MKENHLEDACLDWLASVGWAVVEGEAVAPGGELAARERWSEVVLAPRLQAAVTRLNPALSTTEVAAVAAKVAGYGHQSLVDGNREVYDWLRNGVPLERTAADDQRDVLRAHVIDSADDDELLVNPPKQGECGGDDDRCPTLSWDGLALPVSRSATRVGI